MQKTSLTEGSVFKGLVTFAGPMLLGNLLQQVYNIVDTFVVGRYLGEDALAAVGGTYTLTNFLNAVVIGLCMGSGALVSYCYGQRDTQRIRRTVQIAFRLIGLLAVGIEFLTLLFIRPILVFLHTPPSILDMTQSYVRVILSGMVFVFLYNIFAYLLRAVGNSMAALVALGIASVVNVVLDLVFVVSLRMGVAGAAWATVLAQALSGLGLAVYAYRREPDFRLRRGLKPQPREIRALMAQSLGASAQQSVMTFGILMIQSLLNSFGTTVMAGYTIAVKIDTIGHMPPQELSNAFSLFISQNYGARRYDRIQKGTRCALGIIVAYGVLSSLMVVSASPWLMRLFVQPSETEVVAVGVRYLAVEGSFYVGIGLLLLFYGYYRGLNHPEISLLLTILSLGTRVLLAYLLAPNPAFGVLGIWWAIPIGWILADLAGFLLMRRYRKTPGEESGVPT